MKTGDLVIAVNTVWVVVAAVFSLAAGAQSREDPRVASIHPLTCQRGATFIVTVTAAAANGSASAAAKIVVVNRCFINSSLFVGSFRTEVATSGRGASSATSASISRRLPPEAFDRTA